MKIKFLLYCDLKKIKTVGLHTLLRINLKNQKKKESDKYLKSEKKEAAIAKMQLI